MEKQSENAVADRLTAPNAAADSPSRRAPVVQSKAPSLQNESAAASSLCRPITPEDSARLVGLSSTEVEKLIGARIDDLLLTKGPSLDAFARQHPLEVHLILTAHNLDVDRWLPPDVLIQFLAWAIDVDPRIYLDLSHETGLALIRERAAPAMEIFAGLSERDRGAVFESVLLSGSLTDALGDISGKTVLMN